MKVKIRFNLSQFADRCTDIVTIVLSILVLLWIASPFLRFIVLKSHQ